MRGRKCCDHRHAGHDAAERQHGLDPLAGRHHVASRTETDGVTEKVTHRPAWGIDRRLAAPVDGSSQVRCAPVIWPSRSVTAAIIAGQVSVGASASGR